MLPSDLTRSSLRLATLLGALVTFIACADGVQRVGEGEVVSQGIPAAVATAMSPAPADTVDSLTAARRATVMDKSPIGPRPAPRPTPDSTMARDSTAVRDSARPKVPSPLGSRSGKRHPAFGDTGSPLDSLWPVKGPAPLPGSILPAKRIIAFYGNPKSRRMGILGEFAPDDMLKKLDAEVAAWSRIDPATPAIPALHVIVLVADATPGPSGKYRTRHDSAMIEKVYGWARSRNALMFVDLQIGQSTLQVELPWIEKFLIRPDVHLGIDPEFAMKGKAIPGKRVGTYDAADINYASRFLAGLVDKYKLPPKILVVHRFTPKGVTNTDKIQLDPRVQIVMDMDGFGPPWMKRDTYWRDIKSEPVQFAGWKQFTKLRNDQPPTPRGEILRLWPVPLYIQLQ
jgi:hypothetical protein